MADGQRSITAQEVRELFGYDEAAGQLFRLKALPGNGRKAGSVVGCNHRNYLRCIIGGVRYAVHRLVWLHAYGEWPKWEIDHINGDGRDNRLCNLRDVPHKINGQNQRNARADNKSNRLGATWHKQSAKWRARICIDGGQQHIGSFDDAEAAHAAYVAAKRRLHVGCSI